MAEIQLARQVSFLQLLEEATAIYIRVEIDDPASEENLQEWRNQIEDEAKKIFAEEFGISYEEVDLEVKLWEGSLWAKIKAKLPTLLLILSLYNTGHDTFENISQDYNRVADRIRTQVEQTTQGRDSDANGFWKDVSTREE